jgi:hypothetical protein
MSATITRTAATTEQVTPSAIVTIVTCRRCGRHLRTAESVARGIGPKCLAREKSEAATVAGTGRFTVSQINKAVELITTGGIVPSARPLLWFVVSSDGRETYLVNTIEDTCTCPAGERDVLCYHLAATAIIEAAA